jgi:hypothetical protein
MDGGNYNHCASCGGLISNPGIQVQGAGMNTASSLPAGFTFTGGTPTGSDTNEQYTIENSQIIQFTAPAGTTAHTIYVYVVGYLSRGRLIASLSDAPPTTYNFVDESQASYGGAFSGYYTLTYKAGSANQTLTVTWLCTQCGAWTGIQAIALQ